jgi:hypothetical protein
VVVVDADTQRVVARQRKLEQELNRADLDRRNQAEAIALLIPKRHIQTWILCLCDESVSEDEVYRGRADVPARIRPAAEKFYEWSRPNAAVPDHCVDSLREGLREIRRVP